MKRNLEASVKVLLTRFSPRHCYNMGRDCGLHGATERNCDFRLFATLGGKEAWEKGNRRGHALRKAAEAAEQQKGGA